MKRLLPLLLTLCLLLSLLSFGASAAETRDALADGYYLTGTHNNWDAASLTEALRFHESYGDPDEFILETELTQGQEFKVVKVENGAVTTWYPDGANNNYVVDAAHAGPAIIYFRDTYWNDWAANGGYVWVGGKPAVEYVDENGVTQTCTDYTTANYAGLEWSGWIVVHEDTHFDMRIECLDDVHLILMDGKTLDADVGIHVSNGIGITIYGQAENTGTLNAIIEEDTWGPYFLSVGRIWWAMAAIGTNCRNASYNPDGYDLTPGPITINGGILHLQGYYAPGIGVAETRIDTPDITINGGVVYAASHDPEMAAGIGTSTGDPNFILTGSITINGGEVHATGVVGLGDVGSGTNKVVINGGTVETTGIGTRDDANYATDITINGGVVTVHPPITSGPMPGTVLGNDPGRIDQTAHVAINGGQVTVEGVVGGSQCEVSLGWTDPTDFIQAPGYSGTVTLTDDWAVDGSDQTFEAGPVTNNATLANKKLIPLIPEIVDPIETEALHIYSSISVGTDMVITYTARKNDLTNYNDFWIEVVKHAPEGDVTYTYGRDVLTENSSTWVAQFKHIFAKEMGVNVEARLYARDSYGQIYMSPARSTNIRDYLAGRLIATNNIVEMRVLAADMLNYGAAAQMFMDYETDHLVNQEISAEALAKLHEYETTELPLVEKTNSNYRPEGASNILFNSVTLGNEVVLNLTIRLTEGTEGVQVLVKDHATGEVVTTLDTTWSGSSIQASFNGIGADKMRTEYDFTTIVNGVETGNTRTWSVEAYVGEIRNGNLPLKTAMANALLTYGDSAAAYFAAQ